MSTLAKGRYSHTCWITLILTAAFAGPFSAFPAIVPLGSLAVTVSNSALILSFQTTTTNYYGLQMCPDLTKPWTNVLAGLQGYGLVESITMSNAFSSASGFYRTVIQPTPMPLSLSQSAAFGIIGYDCGGIQEQVYIIGFDPTNGYPVGNVDLKTVCSCGKDCSSTHTASATVTWDFAGNVISSNTPATGGTANPAFIATDRFNDIIYNHGANAYLIVPVPAAPTNVAAGQSGDQFNVSWMPIGGNPDAIVFSTLTATPVGSTNPVLTAIVTGSMTNGIIPTLQPSTTYQITVASATAGGTGPSSVPISVTTSAATIPPSAPTNVVATWANPNANPGPNTLIATWAAPNPGNSPVDQYLIVAAGSDGAGTQTNSLGGTTLTTSFNVDSTYNWSVTVRAHNAAGWGPASSAVFLGGL